MSLASAAADLAQDLQALKVAWEEARAGWDERRGAVGAGLGGLRGHERVEAPDPRIARLLQQLAVFVDEPPQRVVENLPAGGIARGGGPAADP